MAGRADIIERIAELAGEEVLRVSDAASGWPGYGELLVDGSAIPVAMYVAPVGLSHRDRDQVERRFQNPGSKRPILEVSGRELMLLGLWETDEVLAVDRPLVVAADPIHRLGLMTRYSMFVSTTMLFAALERGWSEAQSSIGESIRCFVPSLLSVSFAAQRSEASPSPFAMQTAIEGSGLLDPPEPDVSGAAERARRAGSTLVRDARFSRRIINAYDGRCAMCGLDVGLVQGAHIYPVSAPGSTDQAANGLALCANHHVALDRHLVGVVPETREIAIHAIVHDQVETSAPVAAFVRGTFDRLADPVEQSARPRDENFEKRYEFFAGSYDWLPEE